MCINGDMTRPPSNAAKSDFFQADAIEVYNAPIVQFLTPFIFKMTHHRSHKIMSVSEARASLRRMPSQILKKNELPLYSASSTVKLWSVAGVT